MRRALSAGVALLLVAPSCSSASPSKTTVTVYAASSLTEVFTTLAHRFEAAHSGVRVELNFGASSALATSIDNDAPADVFASASPGPMQNVLKAKRASESQPFATNMLEIAVEPGNPEHITGLADLSGPDLKVAMCDPAVPCGSAARQVLDRAGVEVSPVSLDVDVKATLAKVRLGEVDAALVYVTDVQAAGRAVTGVEIPAAQNATNAYPIAVLAGAEPADRSRDFVAFVRSPAGQAVLAAAGFGPPP